MAVLAVLGLSALTLFGGGAMAGAANPSASPTVPSTYITVPPPATLPSTGAATITVAPGTTATVQPCGFAPGTTVTYTWDDPVTGTVAVDANGCVTVTVAAVGCDQVRINGGAPVTAGGTNTLTFTGTGTNGAPRTYTETVLIPQTCLTSTTTHPTGVAFTGADIALMAGGGLVLLGGGALLIVATRRRTRRQTGWHQG